MPELPEVETSRRGIEPLGNLKKPVSPVSGDQGAFDMVDSPVVSRRNAIAMLPGLLAL
jgi:formamidopyrimidine-DNA glycosylase